MYDLNFTCCDLGIHEGKMTARVGNVVFVSTQDYWDVYGNISAETLIKFHSHSVGGITVFPENWLEWVDEEPSVPCCRITSEGGLKLLANILGACSLA